MSALGQADVLALSARREGSPLTYHEYKARYGTIEAWGKLDGAAQAFRGRADGRSSLRIKMERIMNPLLSPGKLFAKTIAALAIAVFWCVAAVGSTVGVTTLATAVTAATSTPAEAGRRWRGRRGWRGGRGWRGARGWYGGYPYYNRGWYGYPYYRRGWYGPRFGIWFGF
jgi:hypothetical protein